jgi:predicted neutral ceramidase superfamily lipid hydrolase
MNFQEKFKKWQEKMKGKSEEEKHNYALTISFLIGAVVCFFVVSSWYYRIVGGDFKSSVFSEFVGFYLEQKSNLNSIFSNEK